MVASELCKNALPPLSKIARCFYVIISFILVSFGQPAWTPIFGLITAIAGYALFWKVLLELETTSGRFFMATMWFFFVQLVQLSWFISHPYYYIYAVYFVISLILAIQFGIIGSLIYYKIVDNIWHLVSIAALWTLLEWSRLFIFSGFAFNLVGMALAGNIYSLQIASLWGGFGMSFWVIFSNLLFLRVWIKGWAIQPLILCLAVAVFPYFYGVIQIFRHESAKYHHDLSFASFKTVLVQTAFPVEESIEFGTKKKMVQYVTEEWRQILDVVKKHHGGLIDLIVLPEYVVPFGTYANVYPLDKVTGVFYSVFGPQILAQLPSHQWPFGTGQPLEEEGEIMVNNAYWAQGLANYFQAHVIAGLEDAEDITPEEREYYSSAILFRPQFFGLEGAQHTVEETDQISYPDRYEKRILVPMGEYIPFAFCKDLAKKYGVFGSFTAGKEAKVMKCNNILFSPSICYEETFGDLICQGRQRGAEMLVNLTNDGWYPNSRLPLQHFEHARLRTVENGVPLIRACNTGITAAVDCLGRNLMVLGEGGPKDDAWKRNSVFVNVSTYHYPTLYSKFGDKPIIGFCALVLIACFLNRLRQRNKS